MPLSVKAGRGGEKAALVACKHCGTKFHPSREHEVFCCSGCEYVYRLIGDESLERFYDLRGTVSRPVGTSVFAESDFDWLGPLVEASESRGATGRLSLGLEGVSCVGCVWLVDHLFSQAPGGISCRVNVQYGSLDLEWRSGAFDAIAFARRLKRFGYRVCPKREKGESESKQVVWRLAMAGAFALNGMLYTLPGYLGMESSFAFAVHFNWLSAFFASLSLAVGGSYFIGRAIRAAFRGIAHLDLPISIGIVFAYLASWYGMLRGDDSLVYFDFVSTFIFLMLTGRWLQVMAVERNRNRLADILVTAPEVEIESRSGGRVRVLADQLRPGDLYWLQSGQRVPVHSVLRSARASVGMDWISGETESRLVEEGGEISSGASLENQFQVVLEANEEWETSLLAKLTNRSPRSTERDLVAQKWIFRYLLAACVLAVAGGMGWALFSGIRDGLMVFISILVVSCPCALGVAWPFADEIALMRLKQRGVFVTTHSIWNRLARVRQVVFDKTGTLTRSRLSLLNGEILDAVNGDALRALSSLCFRSRHPVARSIREQMMAKGRFCPVETIEVREQVGLGMEMVAFGGRWRLGRGGWASGSSQLFGDTSFTRDDSVICALRFDDQPLPDAVGEVEALRQRGLTMAILSGDRQEKAERVGALLGLEETAVFGGMLPEGKADWLRTHRGEESLMVGDGANDTLAFEEALCCGAPANEQGIVAERADFHFLGSGIQGIRNLIEMGARRRRGIWQLLTFAIAYNVAAVGLALAGMMTPLLAAVLMPMSSVASLAIVWAAVGGKR